MNQKIYRLNVNHNEQNMRLDLFISKKIPEISRSKAKQLILEGKVLISNQIMRKADHRVKTNEYIQVHHEEKDTDELIPQDIPLKIIYEDNSIIAIDKPSGMVVHPGAGNISHTLVNALIFLRLEIKSVGHEKRPGIVHRLDKETSGIIVVAKNQKTYLALQNQFRKREISKEYLAIIHGNLQAKTGKIDYSLGRDLRDRKKISPKTKKGREALTFYKILDEKKGFSFIKLTPKTGRTHQIRVHLSSIGSPILGDKKYGKKKDTFPRMALHSYSIEFFHPEKKEKVKLYSPLPSELKEIWDRL
ncbi:MAG: RluA family pseudouridine synthase [Acidobacteriota bacterium]